MVLRLYYGTPDQDGEGDYEVLIEIWKTSEVGREIIMGNFNSPQINGVNMSSGYKAEMEFLDRINEYFKEQLVLESTKGKAIPDLVLSNTQDLVQDLSVDEPLWHSDLNILKFT